jgi:hypothetical protein
MHLMYFTEQPMSAYPADFGTTALMFSNKNFDPAAGTGSATNTSTTISMPR